MTRTRAAVAALLLLLASGCRPPAEARYVSVSKDYETLVPFGWQVVAEAQGDAFAETRFVGPLDPDFLLGAPSLSVRWYKRNRGRRLRGGGLESYSGAEDFYKQMLRDVYGSKSFVTGAKLAGEGEHYEDGPSDITLSVSGLKARYFTVLSPMPAPPDLQWGVSVSPDGKPTVLRKHSYALVNVADGFYVLCYPATDRGYEKHAAQFRRLLASFVPLTAGPGGAPIRVPGPARPSGS